MKRRRADRLDWQRVLASRFTVQPLETTQFTGHVTLLCLDKVREPLWVSDEGKPLCIADAGHNWLQYFPHAAHYTVTTMFDAEGRIIQWYIDICRRLGLDADGVPWFEDLYLDIVVKPSLEMVLLDEDELEAARNNQLITQTDYELAWSETDRLWEAIKTDTLPLLKLSTLHREWLASSWYK